MTPNDSSDPIVFYIDRCLGRKLAQTLQDQGLTIALHDDHFPQNALDVEWLPKVGQRGWVVLTKDTRISRNTTERLSVAFHNIRMFALTSQNLTGEEMANAFVAAIDRIYKHLRQYDAPFIAKVYRDGRVQLYRDRQTLLNELQQSQ
jgi:predicted nuclease of predicted toxin-antitoxin system